MQLVVGIGFNFPSSEEDYIGFDSKHSLSDADIVLLNPSYSKTSYFTDPSNSTHLNSILYGPDSSFSIKEHTSYWTKELSDFLMAGKTLYITLSAKKDFFVHTGKSQKGTSFIEEWHNYKCINDYNIKINSSRGSKVYPVSNIVKQLHSCIKDHTSSEVYVETTEQAEILFSTKNKDKILGLAIKVGKGNLILLPSINVPSSFKQERKWTKEALEWGQRLKTNLIEVAKSLKRETEKTPPPEWINKDKFELQESNITRELIKHNVSLLEEIEIKVKQLNEVLIEQESLKDLLCESGKPLELAVIKALKLLGYSSDY